MGRNKTINIQARANSYKDDKFYVSDTNILMCGICNMRLEWKKTDTLNKHILTQGHTEKKEKAKLTAVKRQATIQGCIENQKKAKTEKITLIQDTVKMCLESNIPINKIDHPAVRSYLQKYIPGSGDLPCGDTLRREYLPACGELMRNKIKESVKDKPVVIIADETSDSRGRCVFAVLLKTVNPTDKQDVFLASCSFLDTANGTTCCQAIVDTLKQYDVEYANVVGLVSDSARYMGSCFAAMQTLFGEHILHYQCWAHKVSLSGDCFMKELALLNSLISKTKMAFLHGRKIKNAYVQFLRENYPDLPAVLFPSPVITRWNSWFHSVKYLNRYIEPLIAFLKQSELSNTSTQAIIDMFEDEVMATTVRLECTFVAGICQQFVDLIKVLEGSKYPYAHLLWDDLQNLSASLKQSAEGIFKREVIEALAQVRNAVLKGQLTESLKSCGQKSYVKLNGHMKNNRTNNFYIAANTAFNPAIAAQHSTPNLTTIKELKGKMSAFDDMEVDDFVDSYEYFHRQLVNAVKEDADDIMQLLLALKMKKRVFADAALKTIWAPVSSVDVERFFSTYNLVLTDRRTRMKETTIETCSMLSFNK